MGVKGNFVPMKQTLLNWANSYKYHFLFLLIAIIYFFNLFIEVMEVDAAQYAFISMQMAQTKSFLQVFFYNEDYLDKPPLLFWLSSASFLLFGISTWVYKLPSVLVAILGLYSLYRFTKIWYNHEKALLATLIMASSQAMFLMTNDVRTDALLTAWVIFSLWQFSEFLHRRKWHFLLAGSMGIGLAMMTKGPLGLIAVGTGFFFHFLLKQQWKNIFRWEWIVAAAIVLISLLPMLYGLYHQFDLHPEKEVYGLKGPSGVEFFFWTQSFGRITGDIYWDNNTGFFYFFHTILWDYQPWIWLFAGAFVFRLKTLITHNKDLKNQPELISISAFILLWLALSGSSYKLPHYIFVLFPLASVLTADFIFSMSQKLRNRFAIFQFIILHLFWVIIAAYFVLVFPPQDIVLPTFVLFLFLLFQWSFYQPLVKDKIIVISALTAIALNLVMSISFYPQLLQYQSTTLVGKESVEMKKKGDDLLNFTVQSYSLDFAAQQALPIVYAKNLDSIPVNSKLFVIERVMPVFDSLKTHYKILKTYEDYRVTHLSLPFLLKDQRKDHLRKTYLIEKISDHSSEEK